MWLTGHFNRNTCVFVPVYLYSAMRIYTCVPVFSNVYIYWSASQVASAVDVHVKHQNERISVILSSLVSTGVEPREPPSGFITMWLLTCLSAHHRVKSYLDSWVPIIHPVKTSNQFWPFSSSRRFYPLTHRTALVTVVYKKIPGDLQFLNCSHQPSQRSDFSHHHNELLAFISL